MMIPNVGIGSTSGDNFPINKGSSCSIITSSGSLAYTFPKKCKELYI